MRRVRSGENLECQEIDGVFDLGDGCYVCKAEPYTDINGNGFYDRGEPYTDTNEDGLWTQKDYEDNFERVNDVNGDGLHNVLDIVTLANCVLAGNCGG